MLKLLLQARFCLAWLMRPRRTVLLHRMPRWGPQGIWAAVPTGERREILRRAFELVRSGRRTSHAEEAGGSVSADHSVELPAGHGWCRRAGR
jgi:hypothetical protein